VVQNSLNSGPSNVFGPLTVPPLPLAPSLAGTETAAEMIRPSTPGSPLPATPTDWQMAMAPMNLKATTVRW
jgi:hypothetical protein